MTDFNRPEPVADWRQAKQVNQQRTERIFQLFKAAFTEAASEVKAGSAEVHNLSRKSISAWIEDLNAAPEASENSGAVEVEVATHRQENEPDTAAPSWRQLFTKALGIVQSRKGNWQEQLLDHLQENAAKFDADMSKAYGDRYAKLKAIVQKLASQLNQDKASARQPDDEPEAKPVTIEILDVHPSPDTVETTAERLS